MTTVDDTVPRSARVIATDAPIAIFRSASWVNSTSATPQSRPKKNSSTRKTPTRTPELATDLSSPDTDSSPDINLATKKLHTPNNKQRRLWPGLNVPIEYQLGTAPTSPQNRKTLMRMIGALEGAPTLHVHQPDVQVPAVKATALQKPHSRPRSVKPYSFYHILHEYQTTSLHVRPINWNDTHTEAFRMEWKKLNALTTLDELNVQPNHANMPIYAAEVSRLVSSLFARESARIDTSCIRNVLWRLFPDRLPSVDPHPDCLMPFWLGGRPYPNAVKVQAMWELTDPVAECSFATESTVPFDRDADGIIITDPQTGGEEPTASADTTSDSPKPHARPVLAYISRDRLNWLRSSMFRVPMGPNQGANVPVMSLHRKRAMKLRPAVPDEDAYIAATFIAMAQKYFYPRVMSNNSYFRPSQIMPFSDIRLHILSSYTDKTVDYSNERDEPTGNFVVYSATVTAQLLTGLHSPRTKVMPGFGPLEALGSLKITYQIVPAGPVHGLRERLGSALGGLLGDFDATEIEGWSEDSSLKHYMTMTTPPWRATLRQPQVMPNSQEQLVRKQMKGNKGRAVGNGGPLCGSQNGSLKRKASVNEGVRREREREQKPEPMILPSSPPIPQGEGQQVQCCTGSASCGVRTKEKREAEVLRNGDEDERPIKRRRSMAL